MKNLLFPATNISEYFIQPLFCVKGEVRDIPESFYRREDTCYQQDTRLEGMEWADHNSVFYPLLGSFYCNSSHFTGSNTGFEEELESFWEGTIENINSIRSGDYKNMDTEEFTNCYGEEGLAAMKFIGEEYLGVLYDTKVERGRLTVRMYFGDCSMEGDNTSDKKGVFDTSDFESVSDICELDMGIFPDTYSSWEELDTDIVVYSMGQYLLREVGEEDTKWEDNPTQSLFNLIQSGVNTDSLEWGGLEGDQVTDKWVELVESM